MPLVPEVGRKKFTVRLLYFCIYGALILMGATMVLPFLITFSGSMSTAFDYERFWPVSRSLWSEKDRFMRSLTPYFNGYNNWQRQFACYLDGVPAHWSNWGAIGRDIAGVDRRAEAWLGKKGAEYERVKVRAADYAEFTGTYPQTDTQVYFTIVDVMPFLKEYYGRKYLSAHPEQTGKISSRALAGEALKCLNAEWGIPFENFFNIPFDNYIKSPLGQQGWFPPEMTPRYQVFLEIKKAFGCHVFTPGIKSKWRAWLKNQNYTAPAGAVLFPVNKKSPKELAALWDKFCAEVFPASRALPFALRAEWYLFLQSDEVANYLKLPEGEIFSIAYYNKLAGSAYGSLYATPFPVPASFSKPVQDVWARFVMERYPLRLTHVKMDGDIQMRFQNFIKKEIKHLKIANQLFGAKCADWSGFKFTPAAPAGDSETQCSFRDMWKNFVKKQVPLNDRILDSSEIAWQNFLLKKYGSLENINKTYGWGLKTIQEAFPPFMDAYTVAFKNNQYPLTFYPSMANYRTVWNYLLFNANAVPVTALLVFMTICMTLTVNPLAAYALSRFNLKGQDKIILFMLATMAFPAMVSAIPAYLLMRDLGLLNTFWALVLPGAANGMSIFILKGFFDSLPRELYEAATIDGASEMQIFRIVAMPMVKPILAISSLTAFVGAYNGWQWALIICQDKSMWTIAVWLYQATSMWGKFPWLISAGFVIASVPTAIAFISCQKMILRGIILPSMK